MGNPMKTGTAHVSVKRRIRGMRKRKEIVISRDERKSLHRRKKKREDYRKVEFFGGRFYNDATRSVLRERKCYSRRDKRKRKSGIPGCREDICVMKYPGDMHTHVHAPRLFSSGSVPRVETRGKAVDFTPPRYFHASTVSFIRGRFSLYTARGIIFERHANLLIRGLSRERENFSIQRKREREGGREAHHITNFLQ